MILQENTSVSGRRISMLDAVVVIVTLVVFVVLVAFTIGCERL
jgi:hypothetical protein